MNSSVEATANDILDFWFLAKDQPGYGGMRMEWFKKDDSFDDIIRTRYSELIELAINGALKDEWNVAPHTALAHIILVDQFTRNIFRGTPKAFAGDVVALESAKHLVSTGMESLLLPIQRVFVYLPFEHSEELANQTESVRLTRALSEIDPATAPFQKYAQSHHDDIVKFGRFPHRNAILGRESTADELEYLSKGGGY